MDKGGAIVILHHEDHINEANRQFSDTNYCEEFRKDTTPIFTLELENTIQPHHWTKLDFKSSRPFLYLAAIGASIALLSSGIAVRLLTGKSSRAYHGLCMC